jgi:hypothetical protein
MPKSTRSRRFPEPRCGVSHAMIETEAKELGREMDSYLRMSLAENKERMRERLKAYEQADASLHAVVERLPEREQVAIKCMIGRDLHLVVELYLAYLRALQPESPAPVVAPTSPFSEWLFGKESVKGPS